MMRRPGPFFSSLLLAVFLVAIVTIAVVSNVFAHYSALRTRIDATKTRAYALSEQTNRLLETLEGDWTIALIAADDGRNSDVRAQVDEVLRRFRQAAPSIKVLSIDPTDPATIDQYDTLIARLASIEGDAIALYEVGLDDALEAFSDLQLFAQQQATQLETVIKLVPETDPARGEMRQRLALVALLADEGSKVVEAVEAARAVHDRQPIADYETARSILVQALSQWADELYAMSRIYETWSTRADLSPVVTTYAAGAETPHAELAQRLIDAADPLAGLPPLELASIGRQLETGEAALVMGPPGVAIVPSGQLFPRMNLRAVGDGVAFDRRFRGEQVIAAAIRSLVDGRLPTVVFAHVEAGSILQSRPQHADVQGIASLLEASRYRVREWRVGPAPAPATDPDAPVVWVIVPPTRRAGLEPDTDERALIRLAQQLLADGEAVLLNLHPSLLPRYRQPDPWAAVMTPLGLLPQTGEAIFEAVVVGEAEAVQAGQSITDFPRDHLICRAVNGQSVYLTLPVPIDVTPVDGVASSILAEITPDPRRWRERDWATMMSARTVTRRGDPLAAATPVAVAAERRNPTGEGRQRTVVVGSGGWLLSSVADVYVSGGGRVALQNPGNQELALATIAWLAERDELIAPSPVSQQVARLGGLTRGRQLGWGLLAVLGFPALTLGAGLGVWGWRRWTG